MALSDIFQANIPVYGVLPKPRLTQCPLQLSFELQWTSQQIVKIHELHDSSQFALRLGTDLCSCA
jgi:hypothetical protein